MAKPVKSPKKAFLMALIIPGLGHLYVGRFLLFLTFLALINPWTLLYSLELFTWVTGHNAPYNWPVAALFVCAHFSQALDAALLAKGKNRAAMVQQSRAARRGK